MQNFDSIGKSRKTFEFCNHVTLFILVRAKFEFCKSVTNKLLRPRRITSEQLNAGLFDKHESLIGAQEICMRRMQHKTEGKTRTDANVSRSSTPKCTVPTVQTIKLVRTGGIPPRSPRNCAASAAKTRNYVARTDGKPSRSPLSSFISSKSHPKLPSSRIEQEPKSNLKLV